MRAAVTAALGLLLCGCGASTVLSDADPVPSPYDGPMRAGKALECDGAPYAHGAGDYDSGLESVQDDATTVLEDYFDNEGWGGRWPDDGYRVERGGDDRVLLSWDVGQRTKVAFVVTDGITDYRGNRGWGVETWAQCDPAELTESATAELGVQIWEDADGNRIPTTEITSFQGADDCDWQDITFLVLGGERKGRQFLRDVDGELADLTRATYDGSATLPDDARDTEFRREGRELWVARDAAYLVQLSDPADVERWPAAKRPIYCD
ncbi:MAG: hypothetical protein ACXWXO_17600 [Nocardioides sp.]